RPATAAGSTTCCPRPEAGTTWRPTLRSTPSRRASRAARRAPTARPPGVSTTGSISSCHRSISVTARAWTSCRGPICRLATTATPPGDDLNLSAGAPAGFSANAPGAVAAGLSATVQIQLDASTVGGKSGALTLTSDAPDLPLVNVPLSGTVLDHAQASLDSSAV